MKRVTVAWAVLGVLALAGCASVNVAGPPTSTASEAETPSVTPTPSPTRVDMSDTANWILGFGTLGPLTVGGTITDAGRALDRFTVLQQDACPRVAFVTSTTTMPGRPTVTAPLADDGSILQLATYEPGATLDASFSPRTAAGIGLGSTETELNAAYPDAISAVGRSESTVYSIKNGSGLYINFAVTNGAVVQMVTRDTTKIDGEYCG
jgi:hypothetical protein